MKAVFFVLALCLALSLAMPYSGGKKEEQRHNSYDGKKDEFKFQYSAPFVCGSVWNGPKGLEDGNYETTIKIHNSEKRQTANLREKVILSFPKFGKNGESNSFSARLRPGQTDFINCEDIMGDEKKGSEFFGRNDFGKEQYAQGQLLIQSDARLDVQHNTSVQKFKEEHGKKDSHHGRKRMAEEMDE